MNVLNSIALLYVYELRRSLKNAAYILISLSQPLLYLVLFMPLLKSMGLPASSGISVVDGFLPGILVLLVFSAASGQGFGTLMDLQSGMIERLRVTPVSRFALLIAPILVTLTTQLGALTLLIAAAIPMGFRPQVGGLLVAYLLLLLLGAMVASLAVALALKLKNMTTYGAIVNVINLPIVLLSGILLPLSLAPRWMRAIAHVNPLYYVIEAVRQLTAGSVSSPQVGRAFVVVVLVLAVSVAWAARTYRKVVA
jgi:ABC-2 type transport system permease protein